MTHHHGNGRVIPATCKRWLPGSEGNVNSFTGERSAWMGEDWQAFSTPDGLPCWHYVYLEAMSMCTCVTVCVCDVSLHACVVCEAGFSFQKWHCFRFYFKSAENASRSHETPPLPPYKVFALCRRWETEAGVETKRIRWAEISWKMPEEGLRSP